MNNSSPVKSKKLIFSKYNYLQGENIDGYLELEIVGKIVIVDVYIDVFIEENWSYDNSKECEKKKIMTFKVDSNSQFIKLNSGTFKFPFRYITSEDIKPSFEYYLNENNKAYIHYTVEAKIYSDTIIYEIKDKLLIKAKPIIDIDSLSKNNSVHIYKYGFSDQGITEINVTLPKNNFLLNDNISPKITINNTKGKLNTEYFKIILSRKIILKTKDEREQKNIENEIISKIMKVKVLKGTQKEFNINIIFSMDNNNILNKSRTISYKSIKDENYLMPSVSGEFICCEYSLQIILHFEKSVFEKYHPKVTLPIYLVHQLPIEYKLNFEKEIKNSKNENKEENVPPPLEIKNESNNNKINDDENYNCDQSIPAPLANFGIVPENNNIVKNDDYNDNNDK